MADPAGLTGSSVVFGRHAVLEALRAGETFTELHVAVGSRPTGALKDILDEAGRRRLPVKWVPGPALDRLMAQSKARGSHQGVVGYAAEFRYADLNDILAEGIRRGEDALVLVLDAMQDVHNVGSLIRTAEALGVHGVLLSDREAAQVTPAVRNASAGAVAHLMVARIDLLAALDELGRRGVRRVGLDEDADTPLAAAHLDGPVAVIVGSEGRGLRHAVAARCDELVAIPMRGHVRSLNAAAAGSIVLYEAVRARRSGS